MAAQSAYAKDTLPAKARLDYVNAERKDSKLLDKADELFDKETLKNEKLTEQANQCLLKYKAILDLLIPRKCFLMNLTFLQPCDLDEFYQNHFRVGPGSLSAALSDLLITDEMRAVVGGEELMVRVEVRYDDYIRVRRRLCTTELQRSTSVDSLSVVPIPPKETGTRLLLTSLDLATTGTQDSGFTDWVSDHCTKQLVVRVKEKSQQLTLLEAKVKEKSVELKDLDAKYETAKHRLEVQEEMVNSQQKVISRLTQEKEKAQKVLLDNKKEIEDLAGANKGMEGTIEELLAEKTKLTNRLAMMEEQLSRRRAVGEAHGETTVVDTGGKRQTKRKHLGEPSDSSPSTKQSKQGGKRQEKRQHQGPPSDDVPSTKLSKQVGSVLLANDEYCASKTDISSINRQVAQLLRRNGAAVHCTVLHESKEDQKCSEEDDVNLILPVQEDSDMDSQETPSISLTWLTLYHSIYYPNIPNELKSIVGHAGVTGKAARKIKEDGRDGAKLVLFNLEMPEDTEPYKGTRKAISAVKKVRAVVKDAINVDAVFSVGRRVYEYFETKYKVPGESKPKEHFMFLPRPSSTFDQIDVKAGGGEKVVLSVGRVTDVEKQAGLDVAGRAMKRVAEKFPNVRWLVRGIDEENWEKSKNILQENLQSGRIKPTMLLSGTQEELVQDMQQAHLVLMTSRSEPFGLVGLEAIAAGIPVLISDQSGLADMLMDLIKEKKCHADMRHRIVKTSVNESDLDETAKLWADKIKDTLEYSESEFEKALEFKKQILASKYWEESHQNLLRACGLTD